MKTSRIGPGTLGPADLGSHPITEAVYSGLLDESPERTAGTQGMCKNEGDRFIQRKEGTESKYWRTFFFFFFLISLAVSWHVEIPGLGIEPESWQ